MKENKFNDNLIEFIKTSTCSFTCIKELKRILDNNGFIELDEQKKWNLKDNKYYIIRNDASIIAFELPGNKANSYSIITTHSDTPSLMLKPNINYIKENYLK